MGRYGIAMSERVEKLEDEVRITNGWASLELSAEGCQDLISRVGPKST
jgi:hypothetical protein